MNQPLRKLLALVAVILSGSAVAVDGYLASRTPGKPRIERAVLSETCPTDLCAPSAAAAEEERATLCPFARPCSDAS